MCRNSSILSYKGVVRVRRKNDARSTDSTMNSVLLLVAIAVLTETEARPSLPPLPVNPGGIGGLFRGPNSETIIRGPDGSQITSEQIGGAVQTETKLETIIVPDQIAVSSVPLSAPTETINIQSNNAVDNIQTIPVQQVNSIQLQEPHIIETELVDAPEVEPDQSSDLKGPSGTISVRGSSSIVSGPASTTISEPIRKIPIATVPINSVVLEPQVIAPATILTPPNINAGNFYIDPTLTSNIEPQSGSIGSSLQTSGTPLLSIEQTSGAGIADAAISSNLVPPRPPIISVTSVPPQSLPNHNQIILSSRNSPIDVDRTQINLGDARELSNQVSSTVSPSAQATLGLTPALNTQDSSSLLSINQGVSSNILLTPQENLALQNQIASNTRNAAAPPQLLDDSRSWLNIQPISSNVSPQINNLGSLIDLGQTVVSSTQSPVDVDRTSINLGNVRELSSGVSSTVSPLNQDNSILLELEKKQLLTPAGSIQDTSSLLSANRGSPLLTLANNQVVSNTPSYTAVDSRNVITPPQVQIDAQNWSNVPPVAQNYISSTATPKLNNLGPIASVLDTVLVQPTDPRNREVIEFNGKKLENIGNIVPVINSPVLLASDWRNIHQLSVSQ